MLRRTLLRQTGLLAALATPAIVRAQEVPSLDRIRSSGRLRFGVTSAEPWFYKSPLTEEWTGVGVAIGQRLAADLGVAAVPVETSWAFCVAALQSDKIDMMFVLDPTPERRTAVDFPDAPLFYYAMGALVGPASPVRTWADLDTPGTRIAVTIGTSLDKNVSALMHAAEIIRFNNNDDAIAAFGARRVEAVVQFHPALVVQYSKLKLGKVLLPEPVVPVTTSAGLHRYADSSFRDWVSARFAQLYKDGAPDQVFTAYMKSKGIDPAGIPGLVKEAWS